MTRLARRAVLAASALAVPALAQPAAFTRPLRLIVPFPPGGPNDIIARVLAARMATLIGQPVVVDNRAGAGGVTGTDLVAKAAPDGHTVALTSAGALAIAQSLVPNLPYAVGRDLAPVTLVATVAELLAVNPRVPAATLAELVAHARANPGRLNFASSGNGSMPHLAGEQLRFAAGLEVTHVPYRGAAPAVTDLVSGQVQMMFADIPVLLPQVRAGTLRAIAMGSRERSALLADVPTTAEAGLPAVEAVNWYGLVAPGATPAPMLAALHAAAATALKDPEVERTLRDQGAVAVGNAPDAFATYIRAEAARWGEVVRRSGATAD